MILNRDYCKLIKIINVLLLNNVMIYLFKKVENLRPTGCVVITTTLNNADTEQ